MIGFSSFILMTDSRSTLAVTFFIDQRFAGLLLLLNCLCPSKLLDGPTFLKWLVEFSRATVICQVFEGGFR